MAQEPIERQFTVSGPALLRVTNVRGRIDIQPGEEGIVKVTAVKQAGGDAERTEIVMEQDADGGVRVKTEFHKRWEWFFDWRSPCPVEYTIRVPRACTIKARGVSCDIAVQGLQGEIDVKAVSGDVQLRDLAGRVQAVTVSGDISGEGLSGPLEVETVSGDVELTQSSFATVQGKTVSGDVRLEVLPGPGPYRFKSVSGGMDLALPAGSGCAVEMSSVSGRLHTDLPITHTWGQERQQGSEIQGGGASVCFNTVSGDMRVRQMPAASEPAPARSPAAVPAEPAAAPPPPPPTTPTPSPASPVPAPAENPRRAVLNRIARGEITAAEGVEELKKLQGA